ncbi:methyltransferase domain-containing protein [Paludibacter sp. 221]|uniref:tRNA1(Val) (adenine(37)-N6)-methyltransferase n=1 Tax=Paludibacter sp. 221 TaxID=2302939 RepID=UPI0013D4246B|nr:methyltransferase [Paludibacter sp. 221]NDV45743.1 methyltransferase domain-containing protein [Paludibacter sp. 221]
MGNPYFSFKQFTVYHDLCAMKVGIDGVLLGAWADVKNANNILDIGTGSGLIALMLAQRNPDATITAIDIDENAILQSEINIKNSPWGNRIEVGKNSLQDFMLSSTKKYDLIVSNPPFFINSMKAPEDTRTTARHTDTLTHEELITYSKALITPKGKLCIILPINEGEKCIDFAENSGLFCNKKVSVFPKPGSPAKRLLLGFSLEKRERENTHITIESETRHQYTPEFTQLAKDFYLKL